MYMSILRISANPIQRLVLLLLAGFFGTGTVLAQTQSEKDEGWISLFDGKTLNGWKVNENPQTFSVQDGAIVVNGNVSHLFYEGDVNNHDFKNFELKVDVMTFPQSNSGIYFHTDFQVKGFPAVGHEVQVNLTHTDWKKSGSIYNVVNVDKAPAVDNEWYTQHIIVKGKKVRILINGQLLYEYIEPNLKKDSERGQFISHGTFALQGHDPGSKVMFKNIRVKVLPN